jgi:hypothetical protein
MVAPEDAPPLVRLTDTIFEISRTLAALAEQCERVFVSVSDLAHGPPDDEAS